MAGLMRLRSVHELPELPPREGYLVAHPLCQYKTQEGNKNETIDCDCATSIL